MLEISSRIKEPYASLFVQAHRVFEEQGSLKFPEWFREYTSRTLEAYRKEKHLSAEEWEIFLSLGSQTGYLDLKMQTGMLKLSGERWEKWIRRRKRRLVPGGGSGTVLSAWRGFSYDSVFVKNDG